MLQFRSTAQLNLRSMSSTVQYHKIIQHQQVSLEVALYKVLITITFTIMDYRKSLTH